MFEHGEDPPLNSTETEYKHGFAACIVIGARSNSLQKLKGIRPQWVEALSFLILMGLPLNIADIGGLTALHHVVMDECPDKLQLLKILIANGADVNVQNRWGETPLLAALARKDADCVEVLLNSGADINIKDGNGHAPSTVYSTCGPRIAALFNKWRRKCHNCHKEGKSLMKCAICKTAQYCSKSCQSTFMLLARRQPLMGYLRGSMEEA